MLRWIVGSTVVLLLSLLSPAHVAAQASPFDELLAHIPSDANVVMAADVQSLFRSPLGVERKWEDKVARDFRSGLINTPPTALRFVIGQSYDYATLQPRWRIKVNQLSKDVSPERVAQRQGGTIDNVAGLPVVICPRDHLFVQYSPTLVGEVLGLQRQELARCLRTTGASHMGNLSPYLKAAVDSVKEDSQVVMAFDMQDVFHGTGLQDKLRASPALTSAKVDVAQVANALSGLRGARVRLRVTTEIKGELYLDFPSPPEILRGIGKGLILEVLGQIGAELEDVKAWDPTIEGNAFVLRGTLTPASARLILSTVDHRSGNKAYLDSTPQQNDQPQAHLDAKGFATVDYYRSIVALLDDIQPGSSGNKANSTDRRTFYYRQYAEKIDSLPILNVDPQVLAFGQAVSITLRNLSRLSSNTKLQFENNMSQFQQGFATNTYGGYYGGYGGYYGGGGYGYGGGWAYSAYTPSAVNIDNFGSVRSMMASTAQTSQALREQTWQNIIQAKTAIRTYLVDKFKVDI